jgi:recombination protein RecA
MARPKKTAVPEDSDANELEQTLKEVRKRFGDTSVSSGSTIVQPERVSTGSFVLDFQTLGGIPRGRATMIVGERHSGKTTIACKVTASAQRQYPDEAVALVDAEGTFDAVWAAKLGVDLDRLVLFQPETGEAAVDVIDAFIGTREVSMVIVDSVAALTPMAEIESSAEDAHVGLQARLVGGMIRKATAGMIRERRRGHNIGLLFLNQYRSKIGGFAKFGEPKTIPGGRALEFATSLQIVMKNKENTGKDEIGNDAVTVNDHSFQITKNKMNSGGRTGEFRLLRQDDDDLGLKEGDIDDAGTMLAYAKKFGAYTGGGSSWALEFWSHELKFKGLEHAKRALYADRSLYWDLRNFLIASQAEALGMPEYFVERFLV